MYNQWNVKLPYYVSISVPSMFTIVYYVNIDVRIDFNFEFSWNLVSLNLILVIVCEKYNYALPC